MTPLTERLTQAQTQQQTIEQQISRYQQEIDRLVPQLYGVKGRVSLLIEMVEEEKNTREANTPPAADPAAPGEPGQPE